MVTPTISQHYGMSDKMAAMKADKFIREVNAYKEKLFKNLERTYQRKDQRKRYNRIVTALRNSMSPMELKTKKKNHYSFMLLETTMDDRLALYVYQLSPKGENIKCDPIMMLSRHALERIIQRADTSNGITFDNLAKVMTNVLSGFMKQVNTLDDVYKIELPFIGTFVVRGGMKTLPTIVTFTVSK